MKKLFLVICLLAFCVSTHAQARTQSQFGRCFSTYSLDEEYMWTYPSVEYHNPNYTLAAWVNNSGVGHVTYRVGNNAYRFWCITPVTDVRLVASDGKLLCLSDVENGCNAF